ncbi:MAG: hypothetical protein KIT39_17145 [Nitrospirales bacterium]|nr:hypothetical protein [Nitrospirales bacterium]
MNISENTHVLTQQGFDINGRREWPKQSSSPVLSHAEGKATAVLARGAYF